MSNTKQSVLRGKNIYLAGKIIPYSYDSIQDWRIPIVDGLDNFVEEYIWPRTVKPLGYPGGKVWPILPRSIFGAFHYIGPFYNDLHDFSGGHGGPLMYYHGINNDLSSKDEIYESLCRIKQEETIENCLRAIRNADLIFAWIDSWDCYGTLFELGYAKALGKKNRYSYAKTLLF